MRLISFCRLIISIIISELAGIIGGFFTTTEISTWYSGIAKPSFNPPSWVFGPVWTTLYLLMGIALFLIWERGQDKNKIRSFAFVFICQLILNSLWSIIFFGMHNIGLALIEIVILWVSILFTIILAYRVYRISAYLLLPYILWATFAVYLNFSIWIIN